jgi:transposase
VEPKRFTLNQHDLPNMPAKGTIKIPKERRAEIVAIAQLSGNQAYAARLAGVSEKTVSTLVREPQTVINAQEIKKRIAGRSFEVAEKYVNRLAEIVETGSVRDCAGAYKLLLEGGQLAAGQPTSITANLSELRAQAEAELARLRERFGETEAMAILRDGDPELASVLVQ